MLKTMFDRGDLPPRDRLAALNELFVTSEHPMGISNGGPGDFTATARAADISAVNLVELTVAASDVLRTPKMVRQADPELCCVVVASTGKLVVSQAGREAVLGEQDIAFYDSSLPFGLRIGAGGEPTTMLRAHIPRAMLALSADGAERLVARALPGATGFGGLLRQFFTAVTADPTPYRPADVPRLASVAQDLMTALAAHHLDADAAVPEDCRHRTLLLRVDAFILRHLPDPYLSPTTVAAAHHISVGHLHRLFSARDTTVAAWIRHQRLERARQDLTDPARRALPVHLIASRWGFKDHATFTRAFRSAYGIPPKDYRRRSAEPVGAGG
ncbi:helix-turn-helix domain-containing protein [Streptomyces sp. NPDC092296]|uniref:helix-turn-helix domain-containing protein n=1 Tax=Streptomyces sp. NPDC092296 TaxID=3366012 RepID=UPI0037F3BDE9